MPPSLPPPGWTALRQFTGGHQSPVYLVRARSAGRGGEGAGLGVLKWAPVRNGPLAAARQTALIRDLDRARALGYPAPAWLAHGVGGQLQYHIARYAPGVSVGRLTLEAARALVPVLESQRGLRGDPGHCWSAYAYRTLTDHVRRTGPPAPGGRGTPVVRGFGRALGALLAAVPLTTPLPADDLVHGDFRLSNVLLHEGARARPEGGENAVRTVSAVLDVEAAGGGTRAYDYATLLTEDDIDADAWEWVRAAGEAVAGPGALALCFACAALELARFVRARDPARFEVIGPKLNARLRALTPAAIPPRR